MPPMHQRPAGAPSDHRRDVRRRRGSDPARDRGGSENRPGNVADQPLVMLEGAGHRGRQELQPAAEVFARHGVITLIYDKRKATADGGAATTC